ncbi:MAG: hypothetical protein AAGC93_25555 [Cyanobacteria bacterium P01_F01_bin.53]
MTSERLSDNEKTYLHRLGTARQEARSLLQLIESDQLTVETLTPLYRQVRTHKQQTHHRCDWLYSYVEQLHFELKYLSPSADSLQHYKACKWVMGESRFVRQTSGGGDQYGHVILQLRPIPSGIENPTPATSEWQAAISDHPHLADTIPPEFEPTILTAMDAQLAGYSEAGFCLVNTKVVVCGGSFHPVDSKPYSYKVAALQALSAAINGANLVPA